MNDRLHNPPPRKTDGTHGRTPLTRRDRRLQDRQKLLYLTQLAVLTAVLMVLHFTGAAIPLPGTKISLVLVPIAVGALLMGPTAGGILGFVYGVTVYVSLGVMHMDPFTGFLFDQTPVMTALICILKSTAAGVVAGWVYRILAPGNKWVAALLASALVPTVNTGIFVLGCFLIYDVVQQVAAGNGQTAVYFILITCAGINYALELTLNLLLAPALGHLVQILKPHAHR